MIDWIKVENAKKVKVKLKDGNTLIGSGEGLMTAEDFEDEEDQKDTFFLGQKNKTIALDINEITDVYVLEL